MCANFWRFMKPTRSRSKKVLEVVDLIIWQQINDFIKLIDNTNSDSGAMTLTRTERYSK